MNNDLTAYAKRQRDRELRYTVLFTALLRSQYADASRQYLESAESFRISDNDTEELYDKLYDEIVADEFRKATEFYVDPLKKNTKNWLDDIASILSSDFALLISEFIRSYATMYLVSQISFIRQTTEDTVRKIISRGQQAGMTEREIARAIIMQGRDEEIVSRARTVARTETSNAGNKGRMLAIEASGFRFNKMWQGILDARIRNSHRMMDSIGYVPLSYVFSVPRRSGGVDSMTQPHDPSGSAENVVNCRCVLVFEVERDAQGNPIRTN